MEQRRRIAHFAGVAAPYIAIKRCAKLGDDRFFLTPLSPANPRAERNTEEVPESAGTGLRFS